MDEKTRVILFFTVCIGVRFLLVYLAYLFGSTKWFKAITLLIGLGLITNAGLRATGVKQEKGFSGGKVYWNSFLHGLLYLSFVLAASREVPYAWVFLLFDVLLGIGFAINNYFLQT